MHTGSLFYGISNANMDLLVLSMDVLVVCGHVYSETFDCVVGVRGVVPRHSLLKVRAAMQVSL